jgi:multiple sugar transport system substrate-binding protein
MRSKMVLPAAVTAVAVGLAAWGSPGAAAASGGKTLTVLDYMQGAQASYFNNLYAQCSRESGYTFKRLSVAQTQLVTKATQLAASGDTPALVLADGDTLPNLAAEGVLQPLNLTKIKVTPSQYLAGPFSAGTYKGKQYGLPTGSNGEVIVYNKAMLSAAGVTPPKTWAQLTADAKKLTTTAHYGFAVTMAVGETGTWNWLSQLWSNGGSLLHLTAPASVNAMNFWTSFVKDHSSPQAELNWQSSNIEAEFVAGKLAMGQLGTWEMPTLVADAKSKHIAFGQTVQVTAHGGPPVTPFGGEVLAIGHSVSGSALTAVDKCLATFATPSQQLTYANAAGYVPDYKASVGKYLASHPSLRTLYTQLQTSRSRTTELGPKYDAYSAAISTAMQSVATGQQSAKQALAAAVSTASS